MDATFPFFFFNDTATTEIYTLSLHDALPICRSWPRRWTAWCPRRRRSRSARSEEHTSELQSQSNLVCRLLLEKKKQEGVQPVAAYHRTLQSSDSITLIVAVPLTVSSPLQSDD